MNVNIFDSNTIKNEQIRALLKSRESFVLESIKRRHMGRTIKFLEATIKELEMRSRVFTKGRKSLMAVTANPIPVLMPATVAFGAASALGIAAHNLATWNPDYEIAKNMATGSLTLTYKKTKKD